MIYVTGDTHAELDILKLYKNIWWEGQHLTRDDYLVICGDFGAVWRGDLRDHKLLSWYERKPWTTLWVDGNHENHDAIDAFPVTSRFGGHVQVVPGFPHVIHLMRGEVYELPAGPDETARAFVMGGAPSIDRMYRVEGLSWWAREMPSDEEYANATACLDACDWSVDYVFTHEVPYSMLVDSLDWNYAIERNDPRGNELTGFLQYVDEKLDHDRLKMWYAGHYHKDHMMADGHHCILYQQVVPLGEGPHGLGDEGDAGDTTDAEKNNG